MKQNLCDEGKQYREDFLALNKTMPLLMRERIIKTYFQHKRKCEHCDLTWRKEE